ncbi:YegP family protein [Agrobacterium tumefaciens]|nr:YegP family protein [Agrobacterium tumefaciens]
MSARLLKIASFTPDLHRRRKDMYKFEIYQDKAGEYRFRFKASNGETMFSSEGYKAKASAVHAIESIKKNAPGANTVDTTTMTA